MSQAKTKGTLKRQEPRVVPLLNDIGTRTLDDTARITQVTVRPVRVADVKSVKTAAADIDDELDKAIFLMTNLTELTPEQVGFLTLQDYDRIQEVVLDFFPANSLIGAGLPRV